jgi:hypothetical protein
MSDQIRTASFNSNLIPDIGSYDHPDFTHNALFYRFLTSEYFLQFFICRTELETITFLYYLFNKIYIEQTMYLQMHPKKKMDEIYNYYSLAESYREDGKSKKE